MSWVPLPRNPPGPKRVSVTLEQYDFAMAAAYLRALELLIAWCSDVYYVTDKGRNARLCFVFDASKSFAEWQDTLTLSGLSGFVYVYSRRLDDSVVVTVVVDNFLRTLIPVKKWHANNLGKLPTGAI